MSNRRLTESAHDTVEKTDEYKINRRTEGRNGEIDVYTVQVSDESKKNDDDWFKAGNWYEVMIDFDTIDQAREYVKSLGIKFQESLEETIEKQPDTVYNGITIEHFPLTWHTDDSEPFDQDGYVIKSPYYLQSDENKDRYYH